MVLSDFNPGLKESSGFLTLCSKDGVSITLNIFYLVFWVSI